jgi:hypothetical protein
MFMEDQQARETVVKVQKDTERPSVQHGEQFRTLASELTASMMNMHEHV